MILPIGFVYPLQFLITEAGQGVTGQSPVVILRRVSDGAYWTGTAFSPTFQSVPLPEIDPLHQPGLYSIDFNQSIDNSQGTYWAYYQNPGPSYPGVSVEELLFANPVADVNAVAIASAVATKMLVNPAIKIDSADIASQETLSDVQTDTQYIRNNMARQSTLLSETASIEATLDAILTIIQPVAGSNQVVFSLTNQSLAPIPGVRITIKNVTNAITLAVGMTDTEGKLTLGLPNGSFNVLFFKEFVTFPAQPYAITISGDTAVNIACTTFQPVAPTEDTCACYCYITDASGSPVTNVLVRAKLVDNYPYSPGAGSLATKDYVEVTSDGTGYVCLNLLRNAYYELSSPALFFTVTDWKVPDQSSLDLSSLLTVSS